MRRQKVKTGRGGRPVTLPDDRKAVVVIGPSIGYVPLTRGLYSLVDAESVDKLGSRRWHAQGGPCRYYAQHVEKQTTESIHRIVCPPRGKQCVVDHVNGNTLDNRACNLRRATQAQNCRNSKTPSSNTSGFKGVSRRVTPIGSVRYAARIVKDSKFVHLGYFDTPEEAHAAYVAKAREFFGAFARAA